MEMKAAEIITALGLRTRRPPRVVKSQIAKTSRSFCTKKFSLSVRKKDGITTWIGKLYKEAAGFEIGTFNHVLLATLIKKQSAKWPYIAWGYISDIITMVHTFIQKALLAASRDNRISVNILSLLMDDLMDKYRQAISVVDFILNIERAGTPMTLNRYLNDNIQKW